jgi:hypothetical protein
MLWGVPLRFLEGVFRGRRRWQWIAAWRSSAPQGFQTHAMDRAASGAFDGLNPAISAQQGQDFADAVDAHAGFARHGLDAGPAP